MKRNPHWLLLPLLFLGLMLFLRPAYLNSRLGKAAREGNATAVESLIRAGADVNSIDRSGYSPLHNSVLVGGYEDRSPVIQILLRHGANANMQDREGSTPLHYAVMVGNLKNVRSLAQGGADANATSSRFSTPIRQACLETLKEMNSDSYGSRFKPIVEVLQLHGGKLEKRLQKRLNQQAHTHPRNKASTY